MAWFVLALGARHARCMLEYVVAGEVIGVGVDEPAASQEKQLVRAGGWCRFDKERSVRHLHWTKMAGDLGII